LLKNGATPNFIEFKDENENVVASISTSGDLNVTGSISVNGEQFSGGLGYVIGTQLGSSFDPESGWNFETSSAGAFAVGDYVRVVEDSQNYISGFITQVVFSSGSYYISVNPISTLGDPGFSPSFSIHLEGLPGSNGDIGSDGSWATTQTIRYVNAQDFYPEAVDTGKLIQMDSDSWAQTVAIDSSYLSLTAGQRIDFVRTGTNNSNTVTFSATGVTLNGTPGLKLRARYSAATLVCLSSNNYILVGDLSA
jgi:hypothetical protein